MAGETGIDPDWGLAALVVAGASLPYVLLGTILGSTIKFELVP